MPSLKIIILAAGKGERMNSDIPKVLHPVCNKPIIRYVLDVVQSLGVKDICVVLGHQSEQVKNYLGREIRVVLQKKLLGTADAIKMTVPYFKNFRGNILILCGDTPLLNRQTIREFISVHLKTKASCTFVSAFVEHPQGYGRVIRDGLGTVCAIREDKDAAADELKIHEINVGVYCFKSADLFSHLKEIKLNPIKKEYYLTDIVEIFSQKGLRVETVTTQDHQEGLGVNNRVDLAVAQNVMRKRILRDFMLKGVTILDPETTYIDASVKIGRDTTIRPFTMIEQDVRIGDRCLIGPFCRLRPQTQIGNNVEIGNFTEISRTQVGDQSFVKHFSFLGDAQVGRRVNIGAGVVTANFDGKDKHLTRIGDDTFIGSDSILVAPLKIGRRAKTGAGSVVLGKQSVPDGSVAVGVPARILSRRNKT